MKVKDFFPSLFTLFGFKNKNPVVAPKAKEYWYPNPDEIKEMIVSGRIKNAIFPLDALNEQSEIDGGVWLNDISEEQEVDIETKNRHYTLVKRGGKVFLWGHPIYCAFPTEIYLNGSTFGQFTSSLKMKFIGRGMYLEFIHPKFGLICTSEIVDIREIHS